MKTLSTAIMAILLFAGCKKDSPSTSIPKTYLLKTTTYAYMPSSFTSQDQYEYDDKNRVIDFKGSRGEYKYTYDDNNNLITIENYDQSGTHVSTNNFAYTTSQVNVQTVDVGDNGGEPYIFTLNSQ